MGKTYRLAILNTHPIQYFAPLYRRLAQEPDINLTVYYCSRLGVDIYSDIGFGQQLKWDIPLLDGYSHKFLKNFRKPNQVSSFFSLINLGIIGELFRGKYDALLVHGHTPFSNIIAIVAAKLLGTRVFIRGETHLLLERQGLKKMLRPQLMKWFYKICDACLAIGSLNREYYLAHGVPAEHIFLVPYTVDNQFFTSRVDAYKNNRTEIKSELGLSLNAPAILYASKLQQRKHPFELLQAYQQLRQNNISACLLFVGSGEEEQRLKQLVAEQNIPDVFFFGFRNQSELPRFFAVSDVFALPSENEPWGLIINEAMCASLPIVAGENVGAVRDLLILDENGFTCKGGDVDDLRHCLERIISSPVKLAQMGQKSRQIISSWSYEECVKGIKAALSYTCKLR